MKTLAVWYEVEGQENENTEENKIGTEMHVNFLKLKKNKTYDYMLELGFMIDNITGISRMNIHFPFEVKKKDFEDVGSLLHDNNKLANSIFNEHYVTTPEAKHPKQISVKKNEKVEFTIYTIDFNNEETAEKNGDYTLIDQYEGTLLSLNFNNISKKENAYIRFRLKISEWKDFIVNHNPSNWFLQSAFTTVESLDFRINEKRSYNNSLAEEISKGKEFEIKKIIFFLIREAADDIVISSIPFSCREMEDVWSNYFKKDSKGKSYDLKNMIIYQLTRESDKDAIEHFNAFVKIKVRKCNWKTIVVYILVFLLLSIFSNYLHNNLPELLKNLIINVKQILPVYTK